LGWLSYASDCFRGYTSIGNPPSASKSSLQRPCAQEVLVTAQMAKVLAAPSTLQSRAKLPWLDSHHRLIGCLRNPLPRTSRDGYGIETTLKATDIDEIDKKF